MKIPRLIKWFFTSAAIFFALLFLADRLILPSFVRPPEKQGILFPPGAEFPYQTPEFSHVAKINSLGFRDREWQVEKSPGTKRILAIGDSFTFGMGVELEQTWTKLLEKKFRKKGHNVEIANLGSAGADSSAYLEVARKAIPLLNPDIVLVAILQGDDLAQALHEARQEQTGARLILSGRFAGRAKELAQYLYPHTFRIISGLSDRPTFKSRERLLENIWKEQAKRVAGSLRDAQKNRYDRMDETVKEMFLNGHLNPALISMAVNDPHYFDTPLHIGDPEVRKALHTMGDHLRGIKKNGPAAELLVLSIPLGAYVSEDVLQGRKEMGFITRPEMLRTTAPDDSLETICADADIPFFKVTEQFRRQRDISAFYYRYDGHLTPRGHEIFTDLLFPLLEEYLFPRASF